MKNWPVLQPGDSSNDHRITQIVPPKKIDIGKETSRIDEVNASKKTNEVAPNDDVDGDSDQRRHVFVNPKLRTNTNSPDEIDRVSIGEQYYYNKTVPSIKYSLEFQSFLEYIHNIDCLVPFSESSPASPTDDPQNNVDSSTSLFDRLLDLNLAMEQDVSLLFVVLSASFVALLVLILLVWGIRRGCREKIPVRENPLYTGAPARRINNVSFRPSSRHKRAMQERTYS